MVRTGRAGHGLAAHRCKRGLGPLRAQRVGTAGQCPAPALLRGLAGHERTLAYLHGFDPAYEFESPGTILVGHAIEEAVREGAREFHFLRGRESYKYGWGARDRWNRRRTFRRAEFYADAS